MVASIYVAWFYRAILKWFTTTNQQIIGAHLRNSLRVIADSAFIVYTHWRKQQSGVTAVQKHCCLLFAESVPRKAVVPHRHVIAFWWPIVVITFNLLISAQSTNDKGQLTAYHNKSNAHISYGLNSALLLQKELRLISFHGMQQRSSRRLEA